MIATGRRGTGSPIVVAPALIGDVADDAGIGDWLIALGHEVIFYARRGVGLCARRVPC